MGNIISSIKNRILTNSQNKERERIIKEHIANIGEIVEEEDRFICYVKQYLLMEQYFFKSVLELNIDGFFKDDNYNIEYLNKLNLNKPVYYIFDGINFEWCFRFNSKGNCNVIFKNCTFNNEIFITKANDVTFENNTYYDNSKSLYLRHRDYLVCFNIEKLTFINENFVNKLSNKFGIDIRADIIKILNSYIDCIESDVNISANKLIVRNSNIGAYKLSMAGKKLIYFNSDINAKGWVVIDNKNRDYIGYISSPRVIYNGESIEPINGFLKDVSDIKRIKNARTKLILKLYQLSMLCQRIEDRKIENTRRILDEQPIGIISKNDEFGNKYNEEALIKARIELIKKLSDIRDYYQLISDKKALDVKYNFDNQSISKVLKRDDLVI